MPFLASTSIWSVLKGSIILAVLSALAFLYTNYTDMQQDIRRLGEANSVLADRVNTLQSSLDLQIKNQEQSDSMYLELKSVYATLDRKLASNKATLVKLKSEKGTQNEKLLNTPLTPDIIDIANGVRN